MKLLSLFFIALGFLSEVSCDEGQKVPSAQVLAERRQAIMDAADRYIEARSNFRNNREKGSYAEREGRRRNLLTTVREYRRLTPYNITRMLTDSQGNQFFYINDRNNSLNSRYYLIRAGEDRLIALDTVLGGVYVNGRSYREVFRDSENRSCILLPAGEGQRKFFEIDSNTTHPSIDSSRPASGVFLESERRELMFRINTGELQVPAQAEKGISPCSLSETGVQVEKLRAVSDPNVNDRARRDGKDVQESGGISGQAVDDTSRGIGR